MTHDCDKDWRGTAIVSIAYDEDLKAWIAICEDDWYYSIISYCPFCGVKLEEPKDEA